MKNLFRLSLVTLFLLPMSGCYSRQKFARRVLEGTAPVFEDYREYVEKDASLADDLKQDRLGTVDRLEKFIKEGAKK